MGLVHGVARMSRERNRWLDQATLAAVRVAICIVQALPDRWALELGRFLGRVLFLFDRRHRQVAIDNIRHAFPDLESQCHKTIARRSFEHFSALAIELARLPRKLCVANWRSHVTLVHGDRVVGAMTANRPAMIVTAHFGNWELAGYALGLFGFRTHAVARALDNPEVDRFVRRFRERTGQRVLAKKGEYDEITRILGQNGVLATLADQDAGQRGLYVDFFGRPASTHKAIALMATSFDVPLIVVGVPRVGAPMRYEVIVEDVIEPRDYDGHADAIREITQRFTTALERAIRRFPEQYFWMHRRWKHQPVAKRRSQSPVPEKVDATREAA
jgi:KDO2-lipid IV(A) lauroyltransferase